MAWTLATTTDPAIRDADEEVKLARLAFKHALNDAGIRNTLGVALYRAGDFEGAKAALSSGPSCEDWLFLAMAHWKLGEKKEARASYERARVWLSKHPPSADQARFRAEAAALLGVAE